MSALPLDVHLMIDDPDRWAPGYAEAGAHTVTFHAEAAHEPIATARAIRASRRAGGHRGQADDGRRARTSPRSPSSTRSS